MRNFRFLLASALLMLSIGAWAAEKHADLSIATATGNATWTPATNTFAWSQNSYAYMAMTDIAGDLSEWTSLVIESDSYTSSWRVDFIFTDNSQWQGTSSNGGAFYSTGKKTLVLADKLTATQLSSVKEIRINQNSEQNSIVIKDVYLKNDAATPFTRTCSGFTTLSSASNNCYYNTATKNFSWTGSSSNNLQIFEMEAGTLSNFRTLTFTTSDLTSGPYRVLFMDGTTTLKSKPFYSAGTKVVDLNTDSDLAGLDLSAVTSIRFAGQSSAGNLTILANSIYLTAEEMSIVSPISGFEWYDYSTDAVYGHSGSQLQKQLGSSVGQNAILYGPYSGNGSTAYMDVTDYEEMVFTTTNAGTAGLRLLYGNEVVSTTSTNAAKEYSVPLTSINRIGNVKTKNETVTATTFSTISFKKSFEPAFSATAWSFAKDVENTTVSLNRNFTADQSSTIWLPFDLTAEQAAAAGKFYALVALSGDELGFDEVAAPVAYTPYLFVPSSTGALFSSMTTTVKASPAEIKTEADGVQFIGAMEPIANLAKSGYTLYGYNATNGEFAQVGTGVSINTFRAYIAVPAGGAYFAPRLKVSINKTPTAVENVQTDKAQSTKILRNGQLVIIRDGVEYNAQGQVVK